MRVKAYLKILLTTIFIFGYNDLWLDRDERITDGIILQYLHGDGFRLVDNSRTNIINSTIEKIYKNDSLILIESSPIQAGMDTLYYKINYNKYGFSTQVTKVSKNGFDSLTTTLKEIISNLK